MPDYLCVTKCFHTVDTGRGGGGLKHKFFREGDILTVPDGVEVPSHFVSIDAKETKTPRLSNEDSEHRPKRQFPPVAAPIDEVKVRAAEKAKAEKKEVPDGGKDKSERMDRY